MIRQTHRLNPHITYLNNRAFRQVDGNRPEQNGIRMKRLPVSRLGASNFRDNRIIMPPS